MSIIRGRTIMARAQLIDELIEFNKRSDGPWEPAIFVSAEAKKAVEKGPTASGWHRLKRSARVGHDTAGTLDLHLPGDGKEFHIHGAVTKLMLAEVLEES